MDLPIFYSFRRCPYAMRARLALLSSGLTVEIREILLRDKAPAFLSASPKGTVPVLVLPSGDVLEESLDIMDWALSSSDPAGWLGSESTERQAERHLVLRADQEFKPQLDLYKYAARHPDKDPLEARAQASQFLAEIDRILQKQTNLSGGRFGYADAAIAPFVRQFANVDRDWFFAQHWPELIDWIKKFLASSDFSTIMLKYSPWVPSDLPTLFPLEVCNASKSGVSKD